MRVSTVVVAMVATLTAAIPGPSQARAAAATMITAAGITAAGITAAENTAAGITAKTFVEVHEGNWRVVPDPVTQNPSFIYGSRIPLDPAPNSDPEFEAAARMMVDDHPELFGVASFDLELERIHTLPLSKIGSTDKVIVLFRQVIDGLPVMNGNVSVVFDRATGDVIAIDNLAVPHARNADPYPRSSAEDVLAAAAAAYEEVFGFAFTEVAAMEPMIIGPSPYYGRKSPLVGRGATLAYLIDVATPGRAGPDGAPAQARVHVSAAGDLTVFKVAHTAHTADGTAQTNVNLGPEPNTPTNQEVAVLKNAYVRLDSTSGTILDTTNEFGSFSTGTTSPQTLAIEFEGPYCRVQNAQGSDHSIVIPGATTPTQVLLNPSKAEFTTAESAAFYYVNEFREYVTRVDNGDDSMDFQVQAIVNNDIGGTCNAAFTTNAIRFQRSGVVCENTAFMDVVHHEEGHWANNVYNGEVTPSFHEGNADSFAYYINDEPCFTNFDGSGGCLRTALQATVKKCNTDGDETCNGGAWHTEGQALASALWDVRTRLNATHGDAAGDAIADALFMGWMNAFNDRAILDVIQDHWIALDDDNGDLSDLTPNFTDITGGFGAYNWKFPAPTIEVTQAPAVNTRFGAQQGAPITAKIQTIGVLTSADLAYTTAAGGPFIQALTPTGNPNEFQTIIPGMTSPNHVSWTLSATNSAGETTTYFHAGPSAPGFYHVGAVAPIVSYDFEGPGDQGWVPQTFAGVGGVEFQRGNPIGSNEPTDPFVPFSGSQIWGNDLSLLSGDGKYEPAVFGELRSPNFDLSGESAVYLQYRRFLAVEEGASDQAEIRVNGQLVWNNPNVGNLIDDQWVLHDIDISSIAANNPSVHVSFQVTSDSEIEYGGWNIDDFTIYRVDPVAGGFFQTYGQGCPGAVPVNPVLAGSGFPGPGQSITLDISSGLPLSPGLLLMGTGQASFPLQGTCSLLVSGVVGNGFSVTLNLFGKQTIQGTLPPNVAPGDVFLQYFSADPGAPNGQYSSSNGLQMHIQ